MAEIKRIKVGTASCGLAAGAGDVIDFLKKNIKNIPVVGVGCIGHCYAEPIVEIETESRSLFYQHVDTDKKWLDIIQSLSEEGRLAKRALREEKELLNVTGLAGRINPLSIDEYISHNGFKGLKNALTMDPEEVISEVKEAGLRGRGGAGFPTGLKWSFLASKKTQRKIMICNADEGDPGAFMDRSLMESVPHQVLEGMLIGAYATGATDIFIYCRAEYPLAIHNLKNAIRQIEEYSLNNFGDRKIEIIIMEGAGAFVCGEETAMIASLEGRRGTPRFRPPFPTDSGWFEHPTSINNVETFGNIPVILEGGSNDYNKLGTAGSKGTKIFAMAGDLKYPGLIEVPMGITLKEVVFDIGGAEPENVKAVQTGGPSGGCIPVEMFNTPIDYDSLNELGAIMGSGGLIVLGKERCMVETARYFLDFTHRESCGKCTFCRVGTKRMFETLERITAGNGAPEDIPFLEDMCEKIKKSSLCGLGQTAPNPVLSTLRYFKNEYEEHVKDKQCRALICNNLVDIVINRENCIECNLCIKNCAVNAISKDYVVDNELCTRCNSCIEMCPKNTIHRVEHRKK
ncbi:MAG: 4Fe-4S binding protein [Victivallales bacterium]|nr:4Fe-4S binding protein [Victivallales bacterium]